jgi:hypothetical protein
MFILRLKSIIDSQIFSHVMNSSMILQFISSNPEIIYFSIVYFLSLPIFFPQLGPALFCYKDLDSIIWLYGKQDTLSSFRIPRLILADAEHCSRRSLTDLI